jgi:hypothetical protein
VQRIDRLVLLAALVALAVFRLLRSFKAGAAVRRRRQPAIPASGALWSPTLERPTQSPLAPEEGAGR